MEEKSNKPYNYMQEEQDELEAEEEEEEVEGRLSFCDLPIYSSSSYCEPENLSKQDQQSSSSSDDQDLFEFFTEDWSTYPPLKSIVFCGKLIPFKEPPVLISGHTRKPNSINHEKEQQKPPKKRGLFRWNLKLFSRSHRPSKTTNQPKFKCGAKGGDKYGFSVRRVSVLAKPSWHYLMMFGLATLPAEMELRDIRSRQSRRSPSALFRPTSSGGDGEVSRGKGLWGLIWVLGYGGHHRSRHHANAVVKA